MKLRDKRASKRKKEILFAAAQVFNEKGYDEATIEEIAGKIDYTKGSIYYYVKSKQELLFECNKLTMDALIEKLDEILASPLGPEEKFRRAIKMHIKTAIDEFALFSTALQLEFALEDPYKREIIKSRDAYEKKLLSILDDGIEKSVFRIDKDPKIILFIILGAMNWMKHWYSTGGRLTEDKISDMYCDYLIPPLLTDKNRI